MGGNSSRSISQQDARRVALAAQGFNGKKPSRGTLRHLRTALAKMGVLQLDSVQYLCRSHYLPLFSRVGCYSMTSLDKLLFDSEEQFETWAHEASVLPMEDEPLWRWHKKAAKQGNTWKHLYRFFKEKPSYVREVLAEIRDRGGLRHNELSDPKPSSNRGFWAGSSDGKKAMEWLFRIGELGARRDRRFQRVFDLRERIVPGEIRNTREPPADDAKKELLLKAARAHGVGSADCLADYYRIKISQARPLINELLSEGQLESVGIEGVSEPWYWIPGTKIFRGSVEDAATVLSPFDPLVWNRKRNQKLFDFEYKIEIYMPEAKRKFGYYVLPFLLGTELAGRVEVKSERSSKQLRVVGAWIEAEMDAELCAHAMSGNLKELSKHLGFSEIIGPRKGNLAKALRAELAR